MVGSAPKMISLRKSMEDSRISQELEQKDRLAIAALAAYTAAIEGVADHGLRACPPLADSYARSIHDLVDKLTVPIEVAGIER